MSIFTETTIEQLLFELPLYRKIKIDYLNFEKITRIDTSWDNYSPYEPIEMEVYEERYSLDFQHLINFMVSDKNIFGYCDKCKKDLSLKNKKIELDKKLTECFLDGIPTDDIDSDTNLSTEYYMEERLKILFPKYRYFTKTLECTHDSKHKFIFIYKIEETTDKDGKRYLVLKKIGQDPSSLDTNNHEKIKKYKKLSGYNEIKEDLQKAILSYSNAFGVGAFVYLRRVLEKIITFKYQELKIKGKLDADTQEIFEDKNTKFSKRLELIKANIPEYLTENKKIYGILSAGVHGLNEENTLIYFPIVKNCLYIILDEMLEIQEKEKLRSKIAVDLDKINLDIKS